jgi:uncharacterized membrane protein
MMFLGIAAAIAVAVLAWRVFESSEAKPVREQTSPEETLKRRYARGEIDESEFERRMKVLDQS